MPKCRAKHMGCPRGHRVRIVLRSGQVVEDRFEERTDRWVLLRQHGRVPKDLIRTFVVLRGDK